MANVGSTFLKDDFGYCEEKELKEKSTEGTSEECRVSAQARDAGGFARSGSGDEGKWLVCEDSTRPAGRLDVGSEEKDSVKDTYGFTWALANLETG